MLLEHDKALLGSAVYALNAASRQMPMYREKPANNRDVEGSIAEVTRLVAVLRSQASNSLITLLEAAFILLGEDKPAAQALTLLLPDELEAIIRRPKPGAAKKFGRVLQVAHGLAVEDEHLDLAGDCWKKLQGKSAAESYPFDYQPASSLSCR